MSLPNEEFDMLGEDELALLTRRFERLHENWVNTRFGKPGHFVADCLERMENKDDYKHQSRRDHKHKYKNKDERRSRKKDEHSKKA
jgi:hypothetical protein